MPERPKRNHNRARFWLWPCRDDDGDRVEMDVSVGDIVPYAICGTEIKVNGDKLLILKESDILAIVDSD